MNLFLTISRVAFNILTALCVIFDVLLVTSVIKQRLYAFSTIKSPIVYITVMVACGIPGKLADFFVVNAWPVADLIDPINGYENYRKAIGKQVTLLATFSYLTQIFINCLMTSHRVAILMCPTKSPQWFTNHKLFIYCSIIMVLILINLLIPYYSACFVNFNARTSLHESACAPKRHPLTTVQNLYLIFVPLSAAMTNLSMILFIKIYRKILKKPLKFSTATIKRENIMIKQACFIATYLSLFEVGYQLMRIYPEEFAALPLEIQVITYEIRLFAICSLNFFVYFVETTSTRNLVLNYIKMRKQSTELVKTVSSSLNQRRKTD